MKVKSRATLVIGLLLILVGTVLILRDALNITLGKSYSYPALSMAIGALFLFSIRSRRNLGAVLPGLFFFVGGAVILSMNLPQIYQVISVLEPWSFFLLLLGISFLGLYCVKPKDVGLLVPIAIFLGLGTLFALYDFGKINHEFIYRYWPFIPIVIGVLIIIRALVSKSPSRNESNA